MPFRRPTERGRELEDSDKAQNCLYQGNSQSTGTIKDLSSSTEKQKTKGSDSSFGSSNVLTYDTFFWSPGPSESSTSSGREDDTSSGDWGVGGDTDGADSGTPGYDPCSYGGFVRYCSVSCSTRRRSGRHRSRKAPGR